MRSKQSLQRQKLRLQASHIDISARDAPLDATTTAATSYVDHGNAIRAPITQDLRSHHHEFTDYAPLESTSRTLSTVAEAERAVPATKDLYSSHISLGNLPTQRTAYSQEFADFGSSVLAQRSDAAALRHRLQSSNLNLDMGAPAPRTTYSESSSLSARASVARETREREAQRALELKTDLQSSHIDIGAGHAPLGQTEAAAAFTYDPARAKSARQVSAANVACGTYSGGAAGGVDQRHLLDGSERVSEAQDAYRRWDRYARPAPVSAQQATWAPADGTRTDASAWTPASRALGQDRGGPQRAALPQVGGLDGRGVGALSREQERGNWETIAQAAAREVAAAGAVAPVAPVAPQRENGIPFDTRYATPQPGSRVYGGYSAAAAAAAARKPEDPGLWADHIGQLGPGGEGGFSTTGGDYARWSQNQRRLAQRRPETKDLQSSHFEAGISGAFDAGSAYSSTYTGARGSQRPPANLKAELQASHISFGQNEAITSLYRSDFVAHEMTFDSDSEENEH